MSLDHLAALEREGGALISAARRGLDPPVAGCPGWDVGDLVAHCGQVHHWVLENVRTQSLTRIPRDLLPTPAERDELVDWYADALSQLLTLLREVDPDAQAWNWTSDAQRAGWWPRRQAHEIAVHRWDAEHAHGSATPIAPELAADGVDEVVERFLPYWTAGRESIATTVTLSADDTGRGWQVRVEDGVVTLVDDPTAQVDGAASGSASDLVLAMWGRVPWHALRVDGDPEALRSVQVVA